MDHLDDHGRVFRYTCTDELTDVLGLMLAGGTWIIRGTLFLGGGGIIQNFGSIQEVLFLEVALTESWVICESSHGDGGWV
jgi:hypothetical protein